MKGTFVARKHRPPSVCKMHGPIRNGLLTPCLAILQRVLSASVTVDKEVISAIGKGVLVFAAVAPGDTEKEADSLAAKVLKMKMWNDESGGRVRFAYLDIWTRGADECGIVEAERHRH